MERQKILGEVMGPGSDSWHPGVPKSLQFRVPLQIHELNPSLPGDLGSMGLLHGFGCLSLTGESASSRRPAVTFCGLQGPSSNPGLGILMNSRGKKHQTDVFWPVFHYWNICCQMRPDFYSTKTIPSTELQERTFPYPELDPTSEYRH